MIPSARKSQGGNPKCHGSGELTLLDYLEAAEGKIGNLAEKKFTLARLFGRKAIL